MAGKTLRFLSFTCIACILLGLAVTIYVSADEASPSGTSASLDLLKRAVDPNPTLQSYIASAVLSAKLNAVVPIHKTFNGTVYYRKPTRRVIFSNVSGPLSRFKTMTSTTPTYEEALAQYSVTPGGDDGAVSKYSLTPRKQGARVTNLTVSVDDKRALIVHVVWTYSDGGSLSLDQTYQSVGAFLVPAADTIAARFPGYSVDGEMTFTNYQPNVPVPESVMSAGNKH
jgi:hypothetical protein